MRNSTLARSVAIGLLATLPIGGCGGAVGSKPLEEAADTAPPNEYRLVGDPVELHAGESTEFLVDVVRGEGFTDEVTVTLEASAGLFLDPEVGVSVDGESTVASNLSAASVGEGIVTVTAESAGGKSQSLEVAVKVLPADDSPDAE